MQRINIIAKFALYTEDFEMKKRYLFLLFALMLASCTGKNRELEVETYLRNSFYPLLEASEEYADTGYTFDFNVQLPQGRHWKEARARIIDMVTDFGGDPLVSAGKDTLRIDAFIEERVSEYRDDEDILGLMVPYDCLRNGQFMDPYDHYEVYYLYSEDYLGGAHGSYAETYLVLDRNTGKPVGLDEFVKADKASLKEALIARLDEKEECELNEFTLDAVLTPDFYVTDMGVVFVYQPYAVASYAAGIIEVLLTWDEIAAL